MKQLFFIIPCLLISLFASAQGSIIVTEDVPVTQIMGQFISLNRASETTPGWRVQIMGSTDRSAIESTKKKFLARFPNYVAVWRYDAPYYKLRVGAFKTKLEAERLLNIIKSKYPGAYPAKDNEIKYTEFLY